jgi:hypothetical protein
VILSESTLEIDGVRFEFGTAYTATTDADFYLAKPPHLIHDYLALVEQAAGNVVELGIFRGGSAALMALAAQPKQLVVIDLCEPVDELDRFVAERGIGHRVRAHYGIDQSDRPVLAQIMADAFQGEPIDLVIDDASHSLGPTRDSFEELFPLVRPGGRYLIEDWHWELTFSSGLLDGADRPDEPGPTVGLDEILAITEDSRILAALGMELVTSHVLAPTVISQVTFNKDWIEVERGPAELDPTDFRLRDLHRGLAALIVPDESQIPGRA